MDDVELARLSEHLAETLLGYRRAKDISLEELSEASGVSASMISQIERRRTVPTIGVLAKLAQAMDRPLPDLVDATKGVRAFTVRSFADAPKMVSADGALRFDYLTAGSSERGAEAYRFRFRRRGRYDGAAYPKGTFAFVVVEKGELLFEAGGVPIRLHGGQTLEVRLDVAFSIVQESADHSRGYFFVHVP